LALEKVGRRQDAIRSYQQFIKLASTQQFIKLASTQYKKAISYAQQRLRGLEADRNP
jgi:hypothetical protein